ncbi:MAG: hypothetical protein AAGA95_20610, partial [Pseudomonadota bacterium]
ARARSRFPALTAQTRRIQNEAIKKNLHECVAVRGARSSDDLQEKLRNLHLLYKQACRPDT